MVPATVSLYVCVALVMFNEAVEPVARNPLDKLVENVWSCAHFVSFCYSVQKYNINELLKSSARSFCANVHIIKYFATLLTLFLGH